VRAVIFSIIACCLLPGAIASAPPRVAVLDFVGDGGSEIVSLLRTVSEKYSPVDPAQSLAAVRGIGYQGSLNLTLADARALGAAIGCDYYFVGRIDLPRRLGANNENYYQAIVGIYLIETRRGQLALFDYVQARGADEKAARAGIIEALKSRRGRYEESINAGEARHLTDAATPPPAALEAIEILDGEVTARDLKPPVFYQRLKPAYTEEAGSIELVSTVELTAVFGANGEVSEVEVVRWAGFGLDESAIATVKQLRFKPGERAGAPVSVRALVRYNFRRPPSAAEREAEAERLRRSLRQIQKPE
jgi:TonB family protein